MRVDFVLLVFLEDHGTTEPVDLVAAVAQGSLGEVSGDGRLIVKTGVIHRTQAMAVRDGSSRVHWQDQMNRRGNGELGIF